MVICPRCEQTVDETVRTTCPLCFTPIGPQADTATPQPGVAPQIGVPGGPVAPQAPPLNYQPMPQVGVPLNMPQGGGSGQPTAMPLNAPPAGTPVQPMGMPLNAPSAPPLRGPNTRVTLTGEVIDAPSGPSPMSPPMAGNYPGRPAAPRPSYGAAPRVQEAPRRSNSGAVAVLLLLFLGLGGFGGWYWWSHRSNPKESAQKVLTAFKAGDWKTVYDLTEQTDQSKKQFANSQEFADKMSKVSAFLTPLIGNLNFDAQDPKDNDGTTATVPVKISGTVMGQSGNSTFDLKMKHIGGIWKVSGDGQGTGSFASAFRATGLGGGGMGNFSTGGRMGGQ